MQPQLWEAVMERLFESGALDVYLTPVTMKKSRPGIVLTALCVPDRVTELSRVLFEESPTIGVRWTAYQRERLDRETVTLATAYGPVSFKVSRLHGRVVTATPEFDGDPPHREGEGSARPRGARPGAGRRPPAPPGRAAGGLTSPGPGTKVLGLSAGLDLSMARRRTSIRNQSSEEVRAVKKSVSITINGVKHTHEVEPRLLLVHFIRELAGLTGTHVGCDTSQCGACTVHRERPGGQVLHACSRSRSTAPRSRRSRGMAKDGKLHPIQEGFWEKHGLQCGFCTPGMIMSAAQLIERYPKPTEEQIRHQLEGNLCRCTGYHNIVKAIQYAAEKMAGK